MLRQVITWAIVIFLAFYMIVTPGGTAHLVHGILGALANAGTSLARFVN